MPKWIVAVGTAVLAVFAALTFYFTNFNQETPQSADRGSDGFTAEGARDSNMRAAADVDEESGEGDSESAGDGPKTVPVSVVDLDSEIRQLCERDQAMMGAYAGYDFTESPFCPADSTPVHRLELVERPHPE